MGERCSFAVRIKPRAKRDSVTVTPGNGSVQVAVTAPPVENRANEQCVALLAKKLGRPRSSLSIIKGEHCRDKVIACEGLSVDDVFERLAGVRSL